MFADALASFRLPKWLQWKFILILTVCVLIFHNLSLEYRRTLREIHLTILDQPVPSSDPLPPKEHNTNSASPSFDEVAEPKEDLAEEETEQKGFHGTETAIAPPYDGAPNDEYVAVCLSIRDQNRDIAESMLHHYHHHGIRKFYIMDDGSDPPLSTFEYPGIPRSALTFTYQERATRITFQQLQAYNWCIERYRERHQWIAFFDGDEFLEATGNETFREVLESFDADEKVGALGINWKVHTSSGILTRQPSARKAFNLCATDGTDDDGLIGIKQTNTHIKSVVKTSLA